MRTSLATALLAVLTLAPPSTYAQETDLSGVWEADNGDSRYELSWCGPDRTALCARLIWARPGSISQEEQVYVGKNFVDQAPLTGRSPTQWSGRIDIYGNDLEGTVTLVEPDRFVVKGCAFVVICFEEGSTRMPS